MNKNTFTHHSINCAQYTYIAWTCSVHLHMGPWIRYLLLCAYVVQAPAASRRCAMNHPAWLYNCTSIQLRCHTAIQPYTDNVPFTCPSILYTEQTTWIVIEIFFVVLFSVCYNRCQDCRSEIKKRRVRPVVFFSNFDALWVCFLSKLNCLDNACSRLVL